MGSNTRELRGSLQRDVDINTLIYIDVLYNRVFLSLGFPGGTAVKNPPVVQEMQVQSLGCEDPLEEGMATHSKYSCLENLMDRGAWQATVHGVTKSPT